MTQLPRFDHVGITVRDLAEVRSFLEALGLEAEGKPQVVEGHFVSAVIGIEDSSVLNVMMSLPDGGTRLELSQFLRPLDDLEGIAQPANQPGLCNICFQVDDLDATVATARSLGYDLVGEVAEHEDVWRMCYVRGPEQIIVSLAQSLEEAS